MTAFLMECYENGILNKERTGGPETCMGHAEAELELLHQMARNEGFWQDCGTLEATSGRVFLAQGWGDMDFMNDIAMEQKGLEYSGMASKESSGAAGAAMV